MKTVIYQLFLHTSSFCPYEFIKVIDENGEEETYGEFTYFGHGNVLYYLRHDPDIKLIEMPRVATLKKFFPNKITSHNFQDLINDLKLNCEISKIA